jgi:hypothetical protein
MRKRCFALAVLLMTAFLTVASPASSDCSDPANPTTDLRDGNGDGVPEAGYVCTGGPQGPHASAFANPYATGFNMWSNSDDAAGSAFVGVRTLCEDPSTPCAGQDTFVLATSDEQFHLAQAECSNQNCTGGQVFAASATPFSFAFASASCEDPQTAETCGTGGAFLAVSPGPSPGAAVGADRSGTTELTACVTGENETACASEDTPFQPLEDGRALANETVETANETLRDLVGEVAGTSVGFEIQETENGLLQVCVTGNTPLAGECAPIFDAP